MTTRMTLNRARRAELLAAADLTPLLAVADRCLDDAGPPVFVSGPDVGMVMMTVREPVEATRFHLGEVLVTRSEVEHRGVRGWSMRMGDDKPGALAAAICDAEAAAGGDRTTEIDELCTATDARLAAERASEWQTLEPTIVRFEEMSE